MGHSGLQPRWRRDRPGRRRRTVSAAQERQHLQWAGLRDPADRAESERRGRNAGFQWNTGGSSDDPCSPAYHGPTADSEPELTAIQALLRKLYPDTRGPALTDTAAAGTRGMFISLHSDTRMVLFPWAFTKDDAPNDTSLRAIAAQLAADTGFTYGQPGELLYTASGGTDDWAYGELGIPSFTIEIGSTTDTTCNGFLPAYSCMESSYWPTMLPALLNAAKSAGAPYQAGLAAR
ncbi:M14 family zinc carboxypeptidase [Streptomyces sp. CA-135486]|uniref:M14 family zinc carboxypeptidase n=1 Tax=Streptomyces sp. CA-135486 TaxID=3240049 RepID=UPI003D8AA43E